MSFLLLRIPNNDDLFNIDVSSHAVFFQVKDVAFDLGRFTGDGNSLAANLDFFTQAVLKKIPHSNTPPYIGFNVALILPQHFADAKLDGGSEIEARWRRERRLMWQKRSTQWMLIFGAW